MKKVIVQVRMLMAFVALLLMTSCLSVHEVILILDLTTMYNLLHTYVPLYLS